MRMSERPQSYVGVSGVVSPEQQYRLEQYKLPLMAVDRKLLLGVKAVHKTQWLDTPNKYGPTWYPIGDTIADSVRPATGNSMLAAQVYLDLAEARRQGITDYPARFMEKLIQRTGGWLDAVQFDLLPWDDQDYSELFEEMILAKPDLDILLQCQGPIMDAHSPQEIAKRLEYYKQYVSYVLFDASHGTGTRLDTNALRPYVAEASEKDWLGVGVAGGLSGAVVEQDLPELLGDYPHLSFDAEGSLHENLDPNNKRLTLTSVDHYLSTAVSVISNANHVA